MASEDKGSQAGRFLAPVQEDSLPGLSHSLDLAMLGALWPFARRHGRLFGLSLALMPLVALTSVLEPELLRQAVEAVSPGNSNEVLGWVIIQYGILLLSRSGLQFVQTYTMQLAGQKTLADLRSRVFAKVQRLSIGYFDRTPIGRVVTRLTNDVDSLGELFSSGAVTAVGDILLLVGIVVAMVMLDWRLSLVAFAMLPPLLLFVEVFRRLARVTFRSIRARIAELNAFMNEQVQGVDQIQAFGMEGPCAEAYRDINAGHLEANLMSIRYDATLYAVVEGISTIAIGLVLWYASVQLGVFEDPAAAESYKATFVAFYAYTQRFFIPIRDLSGKYTVMQSSLAAAERIFGLLAIEETDAVGVGQQEGRKGGERPRPAAAAMTEPSGRPGLAVEFRGVEFSYEPGTPVLRGVDLEVAEGEMVAIVGATGAGKTTVTSLLQRFYEAQRGGVFVAGMDVRDQPLEALRRRFAMVQQDVFLFGGTLLENVALGDLSPDRGRARDALERVGAWELVGAQREGLDTSVGERGSRLSAGERQLVAFARALYRDPEVLILDEATASVDSATEARLQAGIETLIEGRTAIVIAHRLSTIERADRILVFHHGSVAEQGTHADLLALGGIYARLYRLQIASQEPRP